MISRTLCKVNIYSHNIVFSHAQPIVKEALFEYCKTLICYEIVRKRGRNVRKYKAVYAASPVDKSEIRIHKNLMESVFRHLEGRGFLKKNMEIIEHESYEGELVDFKLIDNRPPKDYQVGIIDYLVEEGNTKVLTLGTGGGKAQPLDAKILTPVGWKTMGEMEVGTEVITGTGETTVVTGVYPQGVKDIYEVTFSDGRQAECCKDHLWRVCDDDNNWSIKSLDEIYSMGSSDGEYLSSIQLPKNIDFSEKDLPMDPYVFGVLMNLGCAKGNYITFTTSKREHIESLYSSITADSGLHLEIKTRLSLRTLRTYDVKITNLTWDKQRHTERVIPGVYLLGSHSQRKALLTGLMMQNTTHNEFSVSTYWTASEGLANGIIELARSLGYKAKPYVKDIFCQNHGSFVRATDGYRVTICNYSNHGLLYRLKYNINKRIFQSKVVENPDTLQLVSIQKVRKAEAQCISIEHPSRLYVTDNYTVTHNTFSALQAVNRIGRRLMIIVPGKYVDKWIEDVEGAFDLKAKELLVIRGASSLKSVLNIALEGDLNAKVLICTTTTLQNYIKDYEYRTQKGYSVPPSELFQTLNVGVKLIDECHQMLHLNFKIDLYTHVAKTLFLSATLESSDAFVNRMLGIVYPQKHRMQGRAHVKYINISALAYNIRDIKKVPHIRRKMYSHTMFEMSLIKQPQLLNQYIEMILRIAERAYMEKRQEGQKLLIFAATKEMCTILCEKILEKWPEETVGRYIGEDAWDNLHTNNIVVSTVGSAGTAVDIINLKTCIMTIAIDSIQQNMQACGRLRQLVNYKDDYPEFVYLYCLDIEKHVLYHRRKYDTFAPIARSHKQYFSGYCIE